MTRKARSKTFALGFLIGILIPMLTWNLLFTIPSFVPIGQDKKSTQAVTDLISQVVFVITSQPTNYHQQLANQLKSNIIKQAKVISNVFPTILLSHEEWQFPGAWTLVPCLIRLTCLMETKQFLVVLDENTIIDLPNMVEFLSSNSTKMDSFYGNAATLQNVIIPDPYSGYVIGRELLKRINKDGNLKEFSKNHQYWIDRTQPIAEFIQFATGVTLQHKREFCSPDTKNKTDCVTFYESITPFKCKFKEKKPSIFVAVKTFEKRHGLARLVKLTWGKEAETVGFFSDAEDVSLPTINTHLKNIEMGGQCNKLEFVLKYFQQLNPCPDWVVFADDNTLISITRLEHLLACYDENYPILLGERYTLNALDLSGIDYISGGPGIVFNKAAINKINDSPIHLCPRDERMPDDVAAAKAAKRLQIPIIGSPLFHQYVPEFYSSQILQHQIPIAFHPWGGDKSANPILIYYNYLVDDKKNINVSEMIEKISQNTSRKN